MKGDKIAHERRKKQFERRKVMKILSSLKKVRIVTKRAVGERQPTRKSTKVDEAEKANT